MECSVRPHDGAHGSGLDGLLGRFGGVLGCHTQEAFVVTRLTIGASDGLQMERNLTGGLPVVYQGHLTNLGPFREHFSPADEKGQEGCAGCMWEYRIAKRTTGKMLGCMRQTRMQMRCT